MGQQSAVGHLQSIVIDVNDMERAAAFWSALLDARVIPRPEPYARLDISGGGASVLLQRVPEPKSGKNRVHIDIDVSDLDTAVRRTESLGGRLLRRDRASAEFAVMADPEGNEFCLVRWADA